MANNDIKKGEVLSESNLCAKRPGTGLEPKMMDFIVGSYAKRDISTDEQIALRDLSFE